MDIPNYHQVEKTLVASGARFAYLFGSRAEERAAASSDVDVAVYFDAPSKEERFRERLKLQGRLQTLLAPHRVDVVVLNDTGSATVRYEVATKGKLICEQDASGRLDFELRAMNEYEDFAPFLSAYNEMYQKANA